MNSLFPPYYYKKLETPDNSLKVPDLSLIQKHVDDYVSFGQVIKFSDLKTPQSDLLSEQLKGLGVDLNQPLKDQLLEVNDQVMQCCIKITESIAQAGQKHEQYVKELKHLNLKFNKICQYIKLKESYMQLLQIYQNELTTLQNTTEELNQKDHQIKQNYKTLIQQLEQM